MSGAVTAAPQPHHLFIRFFLISCNITDRNGAHSILHLFFIMMLYVQHVRKKVKRNCHSFIFTVYGVGSLKTSIYISYCRGIVK